MEFARTRRGISISQNKYTIDLLKETVMLGCKPTNTTDEAKRIQKEKLGGDLVNKGRYQWLVGRLIYLSHTRLDIAFVVSLVSQYMHLPTYEHLEALY